MLRLCVFCGSQLGTDPRYQEAAIALGALMAQRGYGLVYGGGRVGLMGIIADAVLRHGGEVIGVIPERMQTRELAHHGVTQLQVVPTMHARKARMAELAQGFIAMPGGYGTFDELFEIITWAQLRLHNKPIGLLNVAGYFDALLACITHAIQEGFIKTEHQQLAVSATAPIDLLDILIPAITATPIRPLSLQAT